MCECEPEAREERTALRARVTPLSLVAPDWGERGLKVGHRDERQPRVLDLVHEVVDGVAARDGIQAPQTRVAECVVERRVAGVSSGQGGLPVGQAVHNSLLRQVCGKVLAAIEPLVKVACNGAGNQQRGVILVAGGRTLHRDGVVCVWMQIVANAHLASRERGTGGGGLRGARGELAHELLGSANDGIMAHSCASEAKGRTNVRWRQGRRGWPRGLWRHTA